MKGHPVSEQTEAQDARGLRAPLFAFQTHLGLASIYAQLCGLRGDILRSHVSLHAVSWLYSNPCFGNKSKKLDHAASSF